MQGELSHYIAAINKYRYHLLCVDLILRFYLHHSNDIPKCAECLVAQPFHFDLGLADETSL